MRGAAPPISSASSMAKSTGRLIPLSVGGAQPLARGDPVRRRRRGATADLPSWRISRRRGARVRDQRHRRPSHRHADTERRARRGSGQDTRQRAGGVDARPRRCGRRPIRQRGGFSRGLHRGQRPARSEALRLGQGQVVFLNEEEARAAAETNSAQIGRPWELWKAKALAENG